MEHLGVGVDDVLARLVDDLVKVVLARELVLQSRMTCSSMISCFAFRSATEDLSSSLALTAGRSRFTQDLIGLLTGALHDHVVIVIGLDRLVNILSDHPMLRLFFPCSSSSFATS